MVNTIYAAAKTSMGMKYLPVDMINIIKFTQMMVSLVEFKKQLTLYLTEKMTIVAPNLSAFIGDTVGAILTSKVRYNYTIFYQKHYSCSHVQYILITLNYHSSHSLHT